MAPGLKLFIEKEKRRRKENDMTFLFIIFLTVKVKRKSLAYISYEGKAKVNFSIPSLAVVGTVYLAFLTSKVSPCEHRRVYFKICVSIVSVSILKITRGKPNTSSHCPCKYKRILK